MNSTTMYKASEFAKMVNVSIKTLQRWDREGILKALRTPTDRRYYTHSQYLEFIEKNFKDESSMSDSKYEAISTMILHTVRSILAENIGDGQAVEKIWKTLQLVEPYLAQRARK
ncbi:MerR family DNA-binding transcriptional regulator [Desulfosporosinus metallidurans]|uniref:Integrase, experimental n=1 Tax=Desulfosporosinus metallidurans TaxID=1888891 RepID=A0A1Q8R2M3_9FIRM|nr:MerR family DNA-binding transcriptional regulator [Desulfosporosinus metallidurans]OLN33837.1 integrase, experimental [Desulfosporosinus metallidurans]